MSGRKRESESMALVDVEEDVVTKKDAYKLDRGISCIADTQTSALEALLSGDTRSLLDACSEPDYSPNHVYVEHRSKTLLHLAVERNDTTAMHILLESGADVNLPNRLTKQTAFQVALKRCEPEVLRLLLFRANLKVDINAEGVDGGSSLHTLAAKCLDDDKVLRCLALLLRCADINLEKRDGRGGRTPLAILSQMQADGPVQRLRLTTALRMLVRKGADLDADIDGQVIRQVLKEKLSKSEFERLMRNESDDFMLTTTMASAIKEELLDLIYEAQVTRDEERRQVCYDKFNAALNTVDDTDLNNDPDHVNELTLMQRAAQANLWQHVHSLLAKKVDPNRAAKGTAPPLILAAKRGNFKVIEVLKSHMLSSKYTSSSVSTLTTDFTATEKLSRSTVLHAVLRRPTADLSLMQREEEQDYKRCLDCLLDEALESEMRKIVNRADESGNTALHYATQMWSGDVVSLLLEKGANIGMANAFDELPINCIDVDTMESFLNDHCLLAQGVPTSRDFSITIKYDFLAPPRNDDELRASKKLSSNESEGNVWEVKSRLNASDSESDQMKCWREPETEVLWHMSRSESHRQLLKHPVIASFLWLKWQRMSSAYNKNILFFTLFVAALTTLIILLYGGVTLRGERVTLVNRCGKENLTLPTETKATWCITLGLLVILVTRELVQCAVGWWRYIFTTENWLEVALILLTSLILTFNIDEDENDENDEKCESRVEFERQISAVTVVLAWSLLITVVGRHPQLGRYNIYSTMFIKVTTTFAKFLLGFSLFILAFALSFYVLLHADVGSESREYPFFDDLGLCVVKTFGMFVGELEFADLPISSASGYVFFLLFVFLVVVVMMNLLNGLAVSDTGQIAKEAEIYALVSQVNLISYIESVMLGDPFNFLSNWPKIFNRTPNCSINTIFNFPTIRRIFHKVTGASGLLLFYQRLPDKKVVVYPNRKNNVCLNMCSDTNADNAEAALHPDLLDSAKKLVLGHEARAGARRTACSNAC